MPTPVNGNRLRASIKLQEMKLRVAEQAFESNLKVFPDETHRDPMEIMAEIERTQRNIAYLQTIQAQYNLRVRLPIDQEEITLCEAVKRIGMIGHVTRLWRDALPKKDRFRGYGVETRKSDEMVAKSTVEFDVATQKAFDSQRISNELQSAIASANATVIDFEDVPEELLI